MDITYILFQYQRTTAVVLQNMCEVNRERSCLTAASSVYDDQTSTAVDVTECV